MSENEPNSANEGQSELTAVLGKGLKMCLLCGHFDWEQISISCGSEETGCWLEGGASCNLGYFGSQWAEERPEDKAAILTLFLKAETCKDYMPND